MGFADRSYNRPSPGGGAGFGDALTPWVKRLLLANTAVWLLTAVRLLPLGWAVSVFGFSPDSLLRHPWSPLTYMFVHGNFWHLFFNMVGLFFFGPPLERLWGSREFLRFYLVCGGGAAALSFLLIPVIGTPLVIGASGALFGLLLAFALRWPESPIYIWGLLPVKAKWFVAVLALFSFTATFSGGGGGVAHWAHLGGLLSGFVYLRWGNRAARRTLRVTRAGGRQAPVVRGGGGGPRTGACDEPRGAARRRHRPVEPDTLDRVDEILDKIREQGIESLTREERAFLDEMSRRYRSTP